MTNILEAIRKEILAHLPNDEYIVKIAGIDDKSNPFKPLRNKGAGVFLLTYEVHAEKDNIFAIENMIDSIIENHLRKKLNSDLGFGLEKRSIQISTLKATEKDKHRTLFFKIPISSEIFFKYFYEPENFIEKPKFQLFKRREKEATYETFKSRRNIAQERLRELDIFSNEQIPLFEDASDKRMLRDLELRLLGTDSQALLFPTVDKSSKFSPWQKDEHGCWKAEFITIDLDFKQNKFPADSAQTLQSVLREKYGIPDLAISHKADSLFVYLKSDAIFQSLTKQLAVKAGRSFSQAEVNEELVAKIEGMTKKRETIEQIEIDLIGTNHSHIPFSDIALNIVANGKKLGIDIEESVGKTLAEVINAANSTDEIRLGKTVRITLNIPAAIARVENLNSMTFLQKGICGIHIPEPGSNDFKFEIMTNNIHEVAAELAQMFKNTPQLGFEELLSLEGVNALDRYQEGGRG